MEARRHLQNPYVVGNALSDPAGYGFYGRHGIYQFINERLDAVRRPAILLFGHRRIGKTSILRQMPRYLPADYRVVFFDMQGQHDDPFPDILHGLAYEIASAVDLPQDGLDALEAAQFKTMFIPQVFAKLGNDKHRLVILIDEFDTLEVQQPEAKRFLTFLQRWMNEEQEIGFVFVVGRRPETISKLFQDLSAITYAIGRLDRRETEDVIRLPALGVLEYSDEVVERIWELTAGHPLATQLICFELWSRWRQEGVVPQGAVDAVLPAALEAGSNQLNQIYDDLEQSNYRLFLSALAETADVTGSADFSVINSALQRYQVDLSPSLAEIRQTLLTRDIITEHDGCFRFTVELIRKWVARNRPLSRLKDDAALVNEEAYRAFRVAEDFRMSAFRSDDDLERVGLLGQAVGNYRLALGRNPMLIAARVGLVQALTEQGAYEDAALEAERVYLVDHIYGQIYRNAIMRLASNFENAQDYARALHVYERVVGKADFLQDEEVKRCYFSAASAHGEALLREGRYDEAIAWFTRAGAGHAVKRAQTTKGESLLASGQYEQAFECFVQAGDNDAIDRAQARKLSAWQSLITEVAIHEAKNDWDRCLKLVDVFCHEYPSDQAAEALSARLHISANSYWIALANALVAEGDGRRALRYFQKAGQGETSMLTAQAKKAATLQAQLELVKTFIARKYWVEAAEVLDNMDTSYVSANHGHLIFALRQGWRSAVLALPAQANDQVLKVAAEIQAYLDRYPNDSVVQEKFDFVNALLRGMALERSRAAIRKWQFDLAFTELASTNATGEYARLLVASMQSEWKRSWLWRLPLLASLAVLIATLFPGLGVGPNFAGAWIISLSTYFLVSGLVNNAILMPLAFRRWRQYTPDDADHARTLLFVFRKKKLIWFLWGESIGMLVALVVAALVSLPSTLFQPSSAAYWCSLILSAVLGWLTGVLPKAYDSQPFSITYVHDWGGVRAVAIVSALVWLLIVPLGYGLPALLARVSYSAYYEFQFSVLLIWIAVTGLAAQWYLRKIEWKQLT